MKTTDEKNYMDNADSLEEAGRLVEALDVYSQGIEAFPQSAWLHARKGRCLFLLNNYREALGSLSESLALKPDAPTTLFFRGQAHENLGELDLALADYRRSGELKPKADVFINIGLIHKYRHEAAAALESFRAASVLDPENTIAARLYREAAGE